MNQSFQTQAKLVLLAFLLALNLMVVMDTAGSVTLAAVFVKLKMIRGRCYKLA